MANIQTQNLSIHYPLAGQSKRRMTGIRAPKNMVEIGSKRYIHALQNLSFQIKKGQRVGLIGRNGSGKSTLLRVLGGIYAPTGGHLNITGNISSLFNLNLGIQPDLSGRDNIVIRGLIKGWSRDEIQMKAAQIVEFSELGRVIDMPIRTYSDGMRMRLLFAIATSFEPEILLLDEWIGAGDDAFKDKASKRMNELVEQAGITVIASHNRGLLKKVCELGMWLDAGNMRAFGPIDDVLKQMDEGFARDGAPKR